jgi:hypothetical protein
MVDRLETWGNPSRSVDFLICGRSQVRKPVATIGNKRRFLQFKGVSPTQYLHAIALWVRVSNLYLSTESALDEVRFSQPPLRLGSDCSTAQLP